MNPEIIAKWPETTLRQVMEEIHDNEEDREIMQIVDEELHEMRRARKSSTEGEE